MSSCFYTPITDLISAKKGEFCDSLPNVLLLGDSISIGYTPYVREQLKGVANVIRPYDTDGTVINCGSTTFAMAELDEWLSLDRLGISKIDVVHFNWGLHDIAYRHPEATVYGNRDKVRGTLSVTPEEYEINLRQLVAKLNMVGAKLIWATTTVVPPDEAGRFEGDEQVYNNIADKIISPLKLPVNDLFTLTAGFSPELFVKPGDVHYTTLGYQMIGHQVAQMIKSQL